MKSEVVSKVLFITAVVVFFAVIGFAIYTSVNVVTIPYNLATQNLIEVMVLDAGYAPLLCGQYNEIEHIKVSNGNILSLSMPVSNTVFDSDTLCGK